MSREARANGQPIAAMSLLTVSLLFWAGSFRVTAIAAEHTSAIVISALRTVPAALALLIAVRLLRGRLPGRRLWGWTGLTGVLMVALFLEGLAEGTARAGAANASVLANTTPFFVLILGWIFFGERTSWLGVLGLVLGFAGVVVMVSQQLGGEQDTSDLVLGMALALAGAAGWGIGTLIVKWLIERDPGIDLVGLTAGQYVVGAVILLVLALALEGTGGTDWSSGELWASVAYLAVGASAIATLAFFGALRQIKATTASAWLFLVPVVAVLIEVVRGARPDGVVLGGMALAIVGVGLVNAASTIAARLPARAGSPV